MCKSQQPQYFGISLESGKRNQLLSDFQHVCTSMNNHFMVDLAEELAHDYIPELQDAIMTFTEIGMQKSKTFAFWVDFMDGACVLLHLLNAYASVTHS